MLQSDSGHATHGARLASAMHFLGPPWLIRLVSILMAVAVILLPATVAFSQDNATPEATQSAKVKELIQLLDDPEVRAWLASSPQQTRPQQTTLAGQVVRWEQALHVHLREMVQAFGRIPAEAANAARALHSEGGLLEVFGLLLGLLAIGYGAEWLARRDIGRSAASQPDGITTRYVSRLISLAIFTAASLGAFAFFSWPPLLRTVVLTYLFAFVVFRLVNATREMLFALVWKDGDPSDDSQLRWTANFSRRRGEVFLAYLIAAWATVSLLPELGFSDGTSLLLNYVAGIGLLVLGGEAVWRGDGKQASTARKWSLTLFLIVIWCLWCFGLNLALWLGIYALLLPAVVSFTGRVGAAIVKDWEGRLGANPVRDILVVRGTRAIVILLAVLWLGAVLRLNPGVLAASDITASTIMRGLLHGVMILLVADLIWQFVKAYIDGKLAAEPDNSVISETELARRGRLRTLLPIFRNALAALIAAVAGLMVLAELGVQIGPLIAGAGIFGVAIGFGSQTLVKDIVSGIFYLMDDAFRVGEYIQSGSYKGVVESFSLRSVRLRHHRGPVFTVPFGSLGAVQNLSRDWVIDKFLIRVPFDTDIKLVKNLTKEVGAALLADPDAGPQIIDTLKMKGVEQFSDYGMEISFKMMTRPGQITSVRRRALAMIRDAFAANGIAFAQPTVNVGGEDKNSVAAAATVIASEKLKTQEDKA